MANYKTLKPVVIRLGLWSAGKEELQFISVASCMLPLKSEKVIYVNKKMSCTSPKTIL